MTNISNVIRHMVVGISGFEFLRFLIMYFSGS